MAVTTLKSVPTGASYSPTYSRLLRHLTIREVQKGEEQVNVSHTVLIQKVLEVNEMTPEILACDSRDGEFIPGEQHLTTIIKKPDGGLHASISVKNANIASIKTTPMSSIETGYDSEDLGLVDMSYAVKVDDGDLLFVIKDYVYKYNPVTGLFDETFKERVEAEGLPKIFTSNLTAIYSSRLIRFKSDGSLDTEFNDKIEALGNFSANIQPDINNELQFSVDEEGNIYLFSVFSGLSDDLSLYKVTKTGEVIKVWNGTGDYVEYYFCAEGNVYLVYIQQDTRRYVCSVLNTNGSMLTTFNLSFNQSLGGVVRYGKIIGPFLVLGHQKWGIMGWTTVLDLYDKESHTYIKSLAEDLSKIDIVDGVIVCNTQLHNSDYNSFSFKEEFFTYVYNEVFEVVDKIRLQSLGTNNMFFKGKMYNVNMQGNIDVSTVEPIVKSQTYLNKILLSL